MNTPDRTQIVDGVDAFRALHGAPFPGAVVKVIDHVEALFMHCAKALVRGQLWDAQRQIDRAAFPTRGRIILDQVKATAHAADDPEVRAVDDGLAADVRDNLY